MVEVEVQDAIISIVIDVKPVGLVDDLSPPISTVIVFRVSSCIRAAFPQTYLVQRGDDGDDVRVLDARGRWISILSSLTSRHLDRRLDLITGRIR